MIIAVSNLENPMRVFNEAFSKGSSLHYSKSKESSRHSAPMQFNMPSHLVEESKTLTHRSAMPAGVENPCFFSAYCYINIFNPDRVEVLRLAR